MTPIMKKCTTRFINVLEKNVGQEINISEYYIFNKEIKSLNLLKSFVKLLRYLNRYTMDIIWNSATGIDIDSQNNFDNDFLKKSLLVFKDLEDLKFEFIVTSILNEILQLSIQYIENIYYFKVT